MKYEAPNITRDNPRANQVVFKSIESSRKALYIALWVYIISIPTIYFLYVELQLSALEGTVTPVIIGLIVLSLIVLFLTSELRSDLRRTGDYVAGGGSLIFISILMSPILAAVVMPLMTILASYRILKHTI